MNQSLDYAPLGRRVLAFFLDGLVLALPIAIANYILPFVGGFIVLFFYGPLLECSELRATLGKYWVGIQVADLQGRKISLQAAVIRNLLKLVSCGLLFLGFLVALFTTRKQALHDLLADTVVLFGRTDSPIVPAWETSVRSLFGKVNSKGNDNIVTQLERLQALREKGAITEEEFQQAKRKLLG